VAGRYLASLRDAASSGNSASSSSGQKLGFHTPDLATRLASLKLETEALIEAYSSKAHAGLDLYTPQDRFDAYKALGLKVIASPDGTMDLTGGPLCSDLESRHL